MESPRPEAPASAVDASVNQLVADRLREAADLLDAQQANPFRARAYRRAADAVAALGDDLGDLVRRAGREGLLALPGVGPGIAAAIGEILATGRWRRLDRLRDAAAPEALFQRLPGIGPALARRIHETLGIDSLEALEVAAHSGRLATVPGVGPRRAAMLRAELAGVLGRRAPRRREPIPEPPVAMLLDVDEEYRRRAASGRLPRITPRRFNPAGERWLPLLHTRRGEWRFTALYSNTALAHRLGRTRDWVVLYFHAGRGPGGQCTVVTQTRGPLAGRRVVRGREDERGAHDPGRSPARPDGAATPR
jgi:hypothetical protein